MEMRKIEPNTYSFVTKDGYEHMAIMMEEGKYKGVVWRYTKIQLPEHDELKDVPVLKFDFEMLDNGGLEFDDVDGEELINLMGDILSDQIDEQMKTGTLRFNKTGE